MSYCARLASANQSGTSPTPPPSSSSTASTTSDTPPIIQINGDNPAIIQVGATYTDLGAQITGPQADLNLGITTFVNGAPMNPVQLDTSAVATDTIAYVVTDQNGLATTSTRTVIVEPDSAESPTGSTSVIIQAANDNPPPLASTTTTTSTTQ